MSTERNTSPVDSWSTEGRDRDGARAMYAQARHRSDPIDEVQVEHLLQIGYRAGWKAAMDIAEAALAADSQVEPTGFITTVAPSKRRWRWLR